MTLSEVDCTVVYWIYSAESDYGYVQEYPDGVSLIFPDEIFAFDVTEFKSFKTETALR